MMFVYDWQMLKFVHIVGSHVATACLAAARLLEGSSNVC